MLDKLLTRVLGSYKSTVTGLAVSVAQVALMAWAQGGTINKQTLAAAALPLVVGAGQRDAPK